MLAREYLGARYELGGSSRLGCDSAGLVWAVMSDAGAWPPSASRTTAQAQMAIGVPVRGSALQPADRLYFDFARSARSGPNAPGVADHTGLYLGDRQFIHATVGGVVVTSLSGYWLDHLLAARRDERLRRGSLLQPYMKLGDDPDACYHFLVCGADDSLDVVTRLSRVPIEELRAANSLSPDVDPAPGRLLLIRSHVRATSAVEMLRTDIVGTYGGYVVGANDTLTSIAAQAGTTATIVRLVNGLAANATINEGQMLLLPRAARRMGVRVYRAYPTPGAVLRSVPSTDSRARTREVPLKDEEGQRQELYVYEKPYTHNPAWRAVMVDSSKMPWAWMQQQHLEFDALETRQAYCAVGRDAPAMPEPPYSRATPRSVSPVVIPRGNVANDVVSPTKRRAIQIAYWFVEHKVPYQLGGRSPIAVDTSGLVYYCFKRAGVKGWEKLTPPCRNQIKYGKPVGPDLKDLRPGDRLYFDTARLGRNVVDHTGIYIGNGWMIEATPPRCKKTNLRHYLKIYAARRDPD